MNGVVYKLQHKDRPEICYVGSTMTSLDARWLSHKAAYRRYQKEGSKSVSIMKYFEELGIENFAIEQLAAYQVVDTAHLRVYEQLWMRKLRSVNLKAVFGMAWMTKHIASTKKKYDEWKYMELLRMMREKREAAARARVVERAERKAVIEKYKIVVGRTRPAKVRKRGVSGSGGYDYERNLGSLAVATASVGVIGTGNRWNVLSCC